MLDRRTLLGLLVGGLCFIENVEVIANIAIRLKTIKYIIIF